MIVRKFITGPVQANTYLVYDETKEGFVVDPGAYNAQINQMIEQEKIKVKYIVLTHGHADHIGGVESILQICPDAKIVAHTLEDEMLRLPEHNLSTEIYGRPISIKTDIFVNDMDSLKCGNMELVFIHTPGHSIGGMCILCDGSIFSGDTLFRASIGRTDFEGGSFPQIKKSITEKLFVFPDNTMVYPGHMSETTIGYEKEHNPFV
ncbi:MAG: MBL fold metallo-hydrolase [Clostridia bacterium]|nr:MBL fold metallo-hydrolase [Clostridia bacterium]